MTTFTVPILILGFNRPDLISELIGELRSIRPKKVFISIDGPRAEVPFEKLAVEKNREAIAKIDWDCDVISRFCEENLGCGKAVSSAIDWAFSQVDELIVLEDDIRPSPDFFKFCEQGLNLYRNNSEIMTIGGFNRTPIVSTETDLLSVYPEIWGWATWRSKWTLYSLEIKRIRIKEFLRIMKANQFNPISTCLWISRFLSVKFGRVDTWDFQLVYCGIVNKKYHLISPENLISNVGFDSRATHTIFEPKDLPERMQSKRELKGIINHSKERDRIERKKESTQLIYSAKKITNKIIKKSSLGKD